MKDADEQNTLKDSSSAILQGSKQINVDLEMLCLVVSAVDPWQLLPIFLWSSNVQLLLDWYFAKQVTFIAETKFVSSFEEEDCEGLVKMES